MDRKAALLLADDRGKKLRSGMFARSVLTHTDTESGDRSLWDAHDSCPQPDLSWVSTMRVQAGYWAQQGWTSGFWGILFKGSRESVSRKLGRWGCMEFKYRTENQCSVTHNKPNKMVDGGLDASQGGGQR